jgi:hypothetical protein
MQTPHRQPPFIVDLLKTPQVMKRLNDLNNLPDKDKEYILYALDGLIKSAKLQAL